MTKIPGEIACLVGFLVLVFFVLPMFLILRRPAALTTEKLPEKQTKLDHTSNSIYSYYHDGHLWVIYQTSILHHPDCVCHTKLP